MKKEQKKPEDRVDRWNSEIGEERDGEKYFGASWIGNSSCFKRRIFINFMLNGQKVTIVMAKSWARKLKKELEALGI